MLLQKCYWAVVPREELYIMTNAILFLLGFTSITSIYEIAKTGKQTKSTNVKRSVGALKHKGLK